MKNDSLPDGSRGGSAGVKDQRLRRTIPPKNPGVRIQESRIRISPTVQPSSLDLLERSDFKILLAPGSWLLASEFSILLPIGGCSSFRGNPKPGTPDPDLYF
jgi:hypothetical protein